MNTHPLTVLCTDADSWNLRSVLLARLGLRADVAHSPDEALQLLRNRKYVAVVIGCSTPDVPGTKLCRDIRRFDESTPVILFGGSADPSSRGEALAAGGSRRRASSRAPSTPVASGRPRPLPSRR